ncbi:NAD(P)-binding protein [Lipomyces chichibuensis]|uniref:NAD(P)-binding protein n=1 Tax=Lipomyces chichibuensis TaxID=1546026 RepID=UPI003344002B
MHLLILGATGRSGGYAYKYASSKVSHHVTVLIRKSSALTPQRNLTIVEGSVLSSDDIDCATRAAGIPVDAVLDFLDARRTSVNPWSAFVGPERLLPDVVANVARVLHEQAPLSGGRKPRLVVMGGAGTGESLGLTPFFIRFLMKHSNLGKTYDNHNAVNDEIEGNCGGDIIWTLPMPVMLSNSGIRPVKTFGLTEKGRGSVITRESCARWMVDVAVGKMGDRFNNKRIVLSN